MKQLVCMKPGHFEYRDVAEPMPREGYSILRVRQVGVCGTDIHAFAGNQPYFQYPRVLGHEFVAEIVQTKAEGFRIGDKVTVIPYFNCGKCIACRRDKPNCCVDIQVCGVHIDGAMAELFAVPDYSLLHGQGLSNDELALVEPLAIGAHGVRRAGVASGEFVLVLGAGPIGLGTMEFARIAGAEVIALDVNSQRLRFCADKLRIPHTINVAEGNAEEQLADITRGDIATVVIDCTGNQQAINGALPYVAHGGRYVLIGLQRGDLVFSHPEFHKRETTLMSSRNATLSDFRHVIDSLHSNQVRPSHYITDRMLFSDVKEQFSRLSDPNEGVIKAMISMD